MRDRDSCVTELFETYASRLYAYARRHAAPSEAEDLVSEAFTTLLRRSAGGVAMDGSDAFAWLVGTVRKLAANERRRGDTRERYWREAVRTFWHHSHASSPEDTVAERERCLSALAQLADTDREVLLLLAWDGLTADQAAQVLGISRNALGVRLHRARQRLQHAFHPTDAPPHGAATPEGLS